MHLGEHTSDRLCELVKEIDPAEQLDEDVEDVLLQIADDFIEHTVSQEDASKAFHHISCQVSQACALAKHRKAANIDVRDVQVAELPLLFLLITDRLGEKLEHVDPWLRHRGDPSLQEVPTYCAHSSHLSTRSATTEAHKQRMAVIKKALKKY